MDDNDLFLFIKRVRKTRELANEADNILHGIFGYPKNDPIRARRIRLALYLMNKIPGGK